MLAVADGLGDTAIPKKLDIDVATARKWRSRFIADRLEWAFDKPRRGRRRKVADAQVDAVITRIPETTPHDAALGNALTELGLSQPAVSRTWRAFGLAPQRQDSRKLSEDPQFIDKSAMSSGSISTHPRRCRLVGRHRP